MACNKVGLFFAAIALLIHYYRCWLSDIFLEIPVEPCTLNSFLFTFFVVTVTYPHCSPGSHMLLHLLFIIWKTIVIAFNEILLITAWSYIEDAIKDSCLYAGTYFGCNEKEWILNGQCNPDSIPHYIYTSLYSSAPMFVLCGMISFLYVRIIWNYFFGNRQEANVRQHIQQFAEQRDMERERIESIAEWAAGVEAARGGGQNGSRNGSVISRGPRMHSIRGSIGGGSERSAARYEPPPQFRRSPTPSFRRSPTPSFRRSPTPSFRRSPTPQLQRSPHSVVYHQQTVGHTESEHYDADIPDNLSTYARFQRAISTFLRNSGQ